MPCGVPVLYAKMIQGFEVMEPLRKTEKNEYEQRGP
jgi:hypothetical protein